MVFCSVKVCVAGLLLSVAPVVESKISKSFLKAMEPVGSIRAGGDATRNGVFYKSLFSKAIHVGGRDLAENTDDEWGNFGFDISQYSAKYSGCSTVKTFSDDQAKKNGATSVLAAKRFVLFRLCPSFYCNKYTVTGCTTDYGEYAIMMDDYLDAIKTYNDDKRDNYCDYCADCLAYNATDPDSVPCSSAADEACTGANVLCAEDEVSTAFEEFFECKAVEYESDAGKQNIYIAPHCGTDGFTITLSQYSDDQCSTLLTNTGLTIENVTGLPFNDLQINTYFPKECVSCAEQTNVWDNAANDNNDKDGVSEVCESLYQKSAKCNKHYYAAQEASYNSAQQSSTADVVCNFITNLIAGTYDETGEIIIDANSWVFNSSNWKSQAEYLKEYNLLKSQVTSKQIAGLVLGAIGCLSLWIWACCLHSALTKKNISWRPRRGKHAYDEDLSRQNSGIVMGRSRSGPGLMN